MEPEYRRGSKSRLRLSTKRRKKNNLAKYIRERAARTKQKASTSAQIDETPKLVDLDETCSPPTEEMENSYEEEDVDVDVPDLLPVQQPTHVDESNVKIEIEEEPLKIENNLLSSDTHGEPMLPLIKEEPSDEPDHITPEIVELDESERQAIQMFFDSMARTVMTLSPSFVSRIKLEVLRVVTDMEMEAYKEKMERINKPIRKLDNITATNKETEPEIKIEVEDDEEAEATSSPYDPESFEPDHDANYEPLTKKRKTSITEQPTPSSSAIKISRTPRTLHEPVKTFFQSIAYTVTSFPPALVCKAKVAVLKVVSKMEVEAFKSRQSGCQDGGGGADDCLFLAGCSN